MLLLFVNSGAQPLYHDWTVSFSQRKPLGVDKQVIVINDQFPGPLLNATTNDVVNINIHNNLTEPFLMTWNGVQMRKNSWQDGVQETNCPILPGQNWTYSFQLKDQIGSFFYFPSLLFQKAAGGCGPIRVNNLESVVVPFPQPDYEHDILIGDWYNSDYQHLRLVLEEGGMLPLPDGILINGLGPNKATFDFQPRALYRLRISNVGLKTTLNFGIQGHSMLLVETEGAYTLKQYYENLDIHVGQSYSVLVTAVDRTEGASFFIVVASRFIPLELVGVGIIRYSGFQGEALDPIPPLLAPYDYEYSMAQALSIRLDLSVGAARPNPQGSYHYGSINVTRMLILRNDVAFINGKYRYTVNGVSFVHPETPLKLADYYNLGNIFEPGIISDTPSDGPPHLGVSVIDTKYHDYVHVVFENPLLSTQTWHPDGYNFFVVGMGIGTWDASKMDTYNMVDAVYRSTIQVYPLSWTAILIELDNQGMWNLRSQDAEKWYLGQELYIRVKGIEKDPSKISPSDEVRIPQNVLKCGRVAHSPYKQNSRRV
ncbi:Multicopper oxidase [Handroanthus impetiginosus]|uniref:Multicopper oxidase n=1 Tax=Handroanthus impetiginosus TaxID=429701 RepID=A0A2G9GE10_9LAMI|nr:Multicopper oxidase [Handroanthus impetiginosus]